ncbi:MAG: transcriptional repressor [Calditrichaeota bacterium]|nr:MAG: transcriptional repressor [Calditrichota bacterium]
MAPWQKICEVGFPLSCYGYPRASHRNRSVPAHVPGQTQPQKSVASVKKTLSKSEQLLYIGYSDFRTIGKKHSTERTTHLDPDLKTLEEAFRRYNLKITPQRIAIYRELLASSEHPSAVVIHERIRKTYPNVSLDTVNRTLLTFAEIGLVRVVEGRGDPKRFDPNLRPHHHFRCLRCGQIFDFYNEQYDALELPAELQEKFVVTSKRVSLEGICDRCRRLDP